MRIVRSGVFGLLHLVDALVVPTRYMKISLVFIVIDLNKAMLP